MVVRSRGTLLILCVLVDKEVLFSLSRTESCQGLIYIVLGLHRWICCWRQWHVLLWGLSSLSALLHPHWHNSESDTTSDTSTRATSVVKEMWISLGTNKQVPKSHYLQTKNVVAGCRFLVSSWIRGITNGFKNLRCQVKLPKTRIKIFMHTSWHKEKFDMVLEKNPST